MNPQNLSVHAFDSHALRVIDREGEPWFVATDVASVLGFDHTPHMIRMLDDDEAGVHNLDIRSANGVVQTREVTVVSESGLYACILKSRRPEARAFRKWVTSEVLPSIRRSGGYEHTHGPRADQPIGVQHRADIVVSADRVFRAAVRSGRAAGLSTGQSILRAQAVAIDRTGVDVLHELGIDPDHLPSAAREGRPLSAPNADAASHRRFVMLWLRGELDAVPVTAVSTLALYGLYAAWCASKGEFPVSVANLRDALYRAGGRSLRRRVNGISKHPISVMVPPGVVPPGIRKPGGGSG